MFPQRFLPTDRVPLFFAGFVVGAISLLGMLSVVFFRSRPSSYALLTFSLVSIFVHFRILRPALYGNVFSGYDKVFLSSAYLFGAAMFVLSVSVAGSDSILSVTGLVLLALTSVMFGYVFVFEPRMDSRTFAEPTHRFEIWLLGRRNRYGMVSLSSSVFIYALMKIVDWMFVERRPLLAEMPPGWDDLQVILVGILLVLSFMPAYSVLHEILQDNKMAVALFLGLALGLFVFAFRHDGQILGSIAIELGGAASIASAGSLVLVARQFREQNNIIESSDGS